VDITNGDVGNLAASLGYPHIYNPGNSTAFDTSLRVIFLSRFPFLSATAIASPAGGARDMTRLMPVVKVDVPGTTRDPVLVGVHLKSGTATADRFQRTVEMRRLTNYLAASGLSTGDNFLVMGDFNLASIDTTFTALPSSGLPGSFVLGNDITLPISYFTEPTAYFNTTPVTRIVPRQLDNSTVTFPTSGSTIDLFLVSPIIGTRPLSTEIYNSALDVSNDEGLPKVGSPLPSGTSVAASDHLALFGDFELDSAPPYEFTAAGQTVSETFAGFPGTYDPYPWMSSGGVWKGMDLGSSKVLGFRSYGPTNDPSLGFLPGLGGGSATASFVNHSAETLTSLWITYNAEQWRSSSAGTNDTLSVDLIVNGLATPLPQLTYHAKTNLAPGPLPGGVSTPKSILADGLEIAPGTAFQLRFNFTPGAGGGLLPADVFINEFDYDDFGSDTGEFVEIVTGPGLTGTPADISLLLYNGADGAVYGTHSLATFTQGAMTPSGHRIYSKAISGIQNGSPDGFALVVGGVVTEFISYEGSMQATSGAAAGMTSQDIGVSQTGSEPEGESALGLTGTGGSSTSFSWTKFGGIPYSPGQANAGQTFTTPPQPQGIAIDDLAVTFLSGNDSDGDGFSNADEVVFGTNPLDPGSYFMTSFTRPAPGMMELSFPTMTGRSYTVECSTDLSNWNDLATYAGTGSAVIEELTVVPGMPERFYRIRVTLVQ